jgi:hypothetical protein
MRASHLARRGSALLLCCCEAQPQLHWLGRTLLSAAAFTSGSGSSSSVPPPQQPQQPSEQPRSPPAHTPAGGSPQLDTDSLLGGTPSQQQQRRHLPRDVPSLGDWLRNGGPAAGQLPHQQQEPEAAAPPQRRVFIETYGCQMNSSDSEIVASVLAQQRYVAAPSAAQAGIVLLNTCAIR